MDGPMIAVFTGNANPQLAQDIARSGARTWVVSATVR
jgi:hypothetical protein